VKAAKPLGRNKGGRPKKDPALTASELWTMRVHPDWHVRVLAKAKEWDVSGSELVRLMVEMGMVGDMLERQEGETLQEKLKRMRVGK
jgi:hypothetical protein